MLRMLVQKLFKGHREDPLTRRAMQYRRGHLTSFPKVSKRDLPVHITDIYRKCSHEFIDTLGDRFKELNEQELQYIFCFVISHIVFPYGKTISSTAFDDLLDAEALDCSNFGVLSTYLSRLCASGAEKHICLSFVGWDGGIIGNHQMVFLKRKNSDLSILLDPCIGLFAKADFDSVASGKSIHIDNIIVFSDREYLESSRINVIRALIGGLFKPSDLLYYFDGMEHYLYHYGDPRFWPTPGAVFWNKVRAQSG
jgi:hypothetical protein